MSNYKNTSVRINGVGNHVGDTINVKNTHVTNNMYREAPSDGGKGGGDALPAAAFCALIAVWAFFRHFEQAEMVITQASLLSVLPGALASGIAYFRDEDGEPALKALLPGAVAAAAAIWMMGVIRDVTPDVIIDLAASAHMAGFWAQLSNYGRMLVLQNGAAVALCAMAIGVNLLAGARAFAASNYDWCGWLWRLTWRYTPVRHVWTQVLLLSGAWLLANGWTRTAFLWVHSIILNAFL
ncbi:hypothetical protein [Cupriavidus sp. EM10]|uniref:hypothetical protein n=1 Tax=Cupriavidus sp. EM10 TaxID=2839983 RepID=UPI001BFFDF31|nr:hypothetical protein [Cupriavidus sp. EM10]QWE98156.1 hypothetical protein KLP38_28550 [Cupriavidus sp. EM10]